VTKRDISVPYGSPSTFFHPIPLGPLDSAQHCPSFLISTAPGTRPYLRAVAVVPSPAQCSRFFSPSSATPPFSSIQC
jgi:hypothetical protein